MDYQRLLCPLSVISSFGLHPYLVHRIPQPPSLVLAEKEDENGFFKLHCKVNTPAAVNAFLEYWKPYALVLVESELWPNLVLIASANGVMLTFPTPIIDVIQIFTHSSVVMVSVHRALVKKHINILAIIAPRHPDLGQEIALVNLI
ncbi:unnamed protein product [Lactuca virosa]|uniref:3-deoxy-D-manno-octulosonic-acid transferase N-terminal domain-containing protein n=1 Tax=Lactuca virosa TaxID=75947 RepID=A0AAU9PMZ8_9ASTR|nr:unnamed protein product [Lactuca virosa]